MNDLDGRSSGLYVPAPRKRPAWAALTRLVLGVLMLVTAGSGCSGGNTAQVVADPTNQLPKHVNWGSYNLYRFEPGPNGQWIKVVDMGNLQELSLLGERPVMLIHGWGGSIRNDLMIPLAQDLFDNGLATSVFGFEYDSQDAISANGVFLHQALDLLTSGLPPLTWTFINHSMGGLVARAALQNGPLPIADTGNRLITLGTPHLGSPVADAIQNADNATQSLIIVHLDQGGFTNAEGNPSEVDLRSQGFTDLRTDSQFLINLNFEMNNHPQARIFTIAGTDVGNLAEANGLLGVETDDGLVTVASANPVEIGAAGSGTAPVTHTALKSDAVTVFPLIREFMQQ